MKSCPPSLQPPSKRLLADSTAVADAGYSRKCAQEACKTTHFPRTDPVVIMLVLKDGRCMLGRQPWWPKGMYSALAGFVEPGETIEEAVRREVMEEAGIETGAVRYHSTQPWPFPASLMIGCMAEALTEEVHVDGNELQEARWFDRDEMRPLFDSPSRRLDPDPVSLVDTKLPGRPWVHLRKRVALK